MKLPNLDAAVVTEEKIVDYLLSETHPHGQHKAAFFTGFGFSANTWQVLAEALVNHAIENEVAKEEVSPFGTRYVVEGIIESPDGRNPLIRAVWFVPTDETQPRLASAYPLRRRAR